MTDSLPTPYSMYALARHDAERLASVLRALADPARLQILNHLYTWPHLTMRTADIVEAMGNRLTQPTISHHMTVLVEAGLVRRRRDGREMHHTLNTSGMEDVAQALSAGNPL